MVTVKRKNNSGVYAIVRRRVGKPSSFFLPMVQPVVFFSLFSTPRFLDQGFRLLCLLPRLFVRIIRDGESNCRDDVTIIIISFIFKFPGLYNNTPLSVEKKKERKKKHLKFSLRSFVLLHGRRQCPMAIQGLGKRRSGPRFGVYVFYHIIGCAAHTHGA